MERNINKQRFTELVEISRSYNDLSKRCGWKYSNGKIIYKLEQRILKLGLNSNHFLGKSWSAGMVRPECSYNGFELSNILVENKYYKSNRLKKRLIEELGWVDKCVWCGIGPEYNGKPLTLQLDHISGNNCDNRLENLRILCPNCHSQTDTWCSKKRPLKREINFDDVITIPKYFFKEPVQKYKYKEYLCDICKINTTLHKSKTGNGYRCKECYKISVKREKVNFDDVITIPNYFFREPITKQTQKQYLCDICKINTTTHESKSFDGYRCVSCYRIDCRKVKDRPSKEELIKLLETFSYVHIGKMFGVSDNSIRKWLK